MAALRSRRTYATAVVVTATSAFLLLTAGCAVTRLKTSADLAKQSEPLQATPPNPARRLLIVGDSTAVGTGASAPARSVAGLIARDHPDWSIANRARDGARFADIVDQLAGSERFDLVIVMGGGNDVFRLTGRETLQTGVRAVAARAHALAPEVILMPAGNVGNAPFFFAPWSWLMSARARTLHAIVRDAAQATGARYVNLYKEAADDPFAQQPDRLNAADGLHPSDNGYLLWYRELQAQGGL